MSSERDKELLRQQTALAQFGEFALRSDDLTSILQESCRLVCAGLNVDFAKVMERQPDGRTMLIRAGVGWGPGIVGQKRTEIGEGSADALSLRTGRAVVCDDLEREGRFTVPDFLREHGVTAFVNVNIIGADGEPPYGILEVDSRQPRHFTSSDVDFLRTYANLLGAAVERLRVTEKLRHRAEEQERLFAELQHRIKNNMQVMTSLIRIQSSKTASPEAKEELQKIGFRIETLRIIHEKLHAAGQVEHIDLGAYLVDLTSALLRFHAEAAAPIRLVTDIRRLDASPEVAVPLGLIVNEFVTNSLKYAFDGRSGVIGIRVEERTPGAISVSVWDDGKGIPDDHRSGTGMYLIEGLARQIATEAQWKNEAGTRLRLDLRPK